MEELSSHAVLWLRPPMTLIKRSLAENDDAAFRGVETVFSIENERLEPLIASAERADLLKKYSSRFMF